MPKRELKTSRERVRDLEQVDVAILLAKLSKPPLVLAAVRVTSPARP